MDTATIKAQLHNYLEIADDKKLKAIYVMVEDEIKESITEYNEGFKLELDSRLQHYLTGGEMVTPDEMSTRLNAAKKRKS